MIYIHELNTSDHSYQNLVIHDPNFTIRYILAIYPFVSQDKS